MVSFLDISQDAFTAQYLTITVGANATAAAGEREIRTSRERKTGEARKCHKEKEIQAANTSTLDR